MKKLLLIFLSLTLLNAGIWRNNSDKSYRGYNGTDSTVGIIITSQNAIGIGTISPSTPLYVSGNVTATTFIGALTGTATTANYVTDTNVVTNNYGSAVTLNNANNVLYGNGTNLTALNGTQITSGTVDKAYIDTEVVTQTYSSAVTLSSMSNVFYGDGSNLSGVVADTISGDVTLADVTVNGTLYVSGNSIFENGTITINAQIVEYDATSGNIKWELVSGVKTKVYTKYLTGTTDADSLTLIAHGVPDIAKVLTAYVAVRLSGGNYAVTDYNGGLSTDNFFQFSYDGTNLSIDSVGVNFQGQSYVAKIEYYL